MKSLLLGVTMIAAVSTQIAAAPPTPVPGTEVAAARPSSDADAKKRAWFEREVTNILEGNHMRTGVDR